MAKDAKAALYELLEELEGERVVKVSDYCNGFRALFNSCSFRYSSRISCFD